MSTLPANSNPPTIKHKRVWEKKAGAREYDIWYTEHICSANHHNSSGGMETTGVIEVFPLSIKKILAFLSILYR